VSTFWDNLKSSVQPYPVKAETIESVWDSIPEQSLEELDNDCVHYFIIPTGQSEVIGQCRECNGERWFKNYYEQPKFDSPTTAQQMQAYADAEQSSGESLPDIGLVGGIA
jgi:hypothetical protein